MNHTNLRGLIGIMAAILTTALPAFPTAGFGIQYGYDLSLSMPNESGEQADFTDLTLNLPNAPTNLATISGKDLPIYINRTSWTRNWFDVGAKVYVDCIPLIDALELSTNYGMWEYQGSIIYPKSISFSSPDAQSAANVSSSSNPYPGLPGATIQYDTANITMNKLGLSNPFIQNTPFAKLQFDLTVRKYLLKLPPVATTLRFYGGAGVSLYFATPLLSANLIEKAVGNTLSTVNTLGDLNTNAFGSPTVETEIAKEFLNELFTPHWGGHLDLGVMLKAPFMPVGIYVDGKYLIPFGPLDPNVPALKSNGILINSGIALDF